MITDFSTKLSKNRVCEYSVPIHTRHIPDTYPIHMNILWQLYEYPLNTPWIPHPWEKEGSKRPLTTNNHPNSFKHSKIHPESTFAKCRRDSSTLAFFKKFAHFACACAFFFVPLQPINEALPFYSIPFYSPAGGLRPSSGAWRAFPQRPGGCIGLRIVLEIEK